MTSTLPPSASGLRALLPALVLAAAAGTIALGATMAPPAVGEMAVVFPLFTDELTAWALVTQAGGMLVAPTRLGNVVVAYAPDPQFQHRMRQLGAVFFVAARGLCSSRAISAGSP